jgi:hypothetical protein
VTVRNNLNEIVLIYNWTLSLLDQPGDIVMVGKLHVSMLISGGVAANGWLCRSLSSIRERVAGSLALPGKIWLSSRQNTSAGNSFEGSIVRWG